MLNKIIGKLNISSKNMSASRGAFFYLFCQMVIRVLSFLSVPIFSRIMTKEDFGMFSNFTAWSVLLYTIVTLDFRDSIYKSKYKFENDQYSYLLSVLLSANIVTIVSYLIIEAKMRYFVVLFSLSSVYIRILFTYLIFYTVYDYVKMIFNVNREYIKYTIYLVIVEAISIILAFFLVIFSDQKLIGRIAGYVIPTIIINLGIYVWVIFKGKKIHLKYIKYALMIGMPLIPSSLSSTLLISSDRAMITNMWGSEQTALYQMGYSVASIVSMIWMALNQAFGPWFYDNLSKNNLVQIRRKTNIYIYLFSILIIGIMFLSPEVLLVMGGKAYSMAIHIIPPVTLGMVFQFFYAFYYDIEYYYEYVKLISLGTVLSGAINVGLNLIFIPKWGYIAAAYTTLIGYAALFLFHFIICKFKLKKINIFDSKIIFLFMCILIVVQYFITILYDKITIRYILFLVYLIISVCYLYKQKEVLLSFVKRKNGK